MAELLDLMNRWYPAQLGSRGLLVDLIGARDYAAIHRHGTTIAYYNAGYGRALDEAATLARWLGKNGQATAWRTRIGPLRRAFNASFWDAKAGAYLDSTTGPRVHPEDGNAFAVLAGFASPMRARSALDYLGNATRESYGNTLLDIDAWSYPGWGGLSNLRVYPFIGYFEVLARYAAGLDDSALELIRREWGYMVANGPHKACGRTSARMAEGRRTRWDSRGSTGGRAVPRLH